MMKTAIRTLIGVCIVLALSASSLVGCAPSEGGGADGGDDGGAEKSYGTWRYGCVHPLGSPTAEMNERFAELVNERSDGRIDIECYGAAQLGDWTELFENVMVGTLDMGLTPAVDSYDPRFGIDWAPYRFFTWEQAREAYQPGGWIVSILENIYASNNIKLLGYGFRGFTGVSLNECPGVLPPEPTGIKIRTVPISSWKAAWETLGYLPVAIPFAEVYTSIQTGVVEGQAGGGAEQLYTLVGDIQGCWIQTNDWMDNQPIGINMDLWNTIEPEDQALLVDTMTEVMWADGGYNDETQELESVWLQKAQDDYGIEIIMLDEDRLAECAQKVRDAVWPSMESSIGSTVYEKMLAEAPSV